MNRDKKIAIYMAPFLAIAGYIGAGYWPDDEPAMRTLVLQNECRLAENNCVLKTSGLELKLSADQKLVADDSVNVAISSSSKLGDVLVSFAAKGKDSRPHRLKEKEENLWRGKVFIKRDIDEKQLRLRLIVDWQGKIYFADEKIKQ